MRPYKRERMRCTRAMMPGARDDGRVSTPQIEELAAAIRKNTARTSPLLKKQARHIADDFRTDLPGIPDEHIGEVLLRAAVFCANVFQHQPGASARDLANMLGAAGQRLYHHPRACGDGSPGCEAAEDA